MLLRAAIRYERSAQCCRNERNRVVHPTDLSVAVPDPDVVRVLPSFGG